MYCIMTLCYFCTVLDPNFHDSEFHGIGKIILALLIIFLICWNVFYIEGKQCWEKPTRYFGFKNWENYYDILQYVGTFLIVVTTSFTNIDSPLFSMEMKRNYSAGILLILLQKLVFDWLRLF